MSDQLISETDYNRAVKELTRLELIRKEIGAEIKQWDSNSKHPEFKDAMAVLQKRRAAVNQRIKDIRPITTAYLNQTRVKNQERLEQFSQEEYLHQGKTVAQKVSYALRLLKKVLKDKYSGEWTQEEAWLMQTLHDAISENGYIHRAEVINNELLELQKLHLAELKNLRQQISELQQRDATARQVLGALWESRYDEVDAFRVAHGVRYRLHIDEATAAVICDVI